MHAILTLYTNDPGDQRFIEIIGLLTSLLIHIDSLFYTYVWN